jgi:hypothetical protein
MPSTTPAQSNELMFIRIVFEGIQLTGRRSSNKLMCGIRVPHHIAYDQLVSKILDSILAYSGFGLPNAETQPLGNDKKQLKLASLHVGFRDLQEIKSQEDVQRLLVGKYIKAKVVVRADVQDSDFKDEKKLY